MKLTNQKPGGRGLANLCFVNSWLQSLRGIKEFEQFFKLRKFDESPNNNCRQNASVSNEMARLFNMRGTVVASAFSLRSLVARGSGRLQLANGEQQCLDDFHQAVFRCLQAEFEKIDSRAGTALLDKFRTTLVREKRFEERCERCGDQMLDPVMDFDNVLRVDGLENCGNITLSRLLAAKASSKHFSGQRCHCKCVCNHGSLPCSCNGICNRSNMNCKCNRVTITTERILTQPQYLVILLQRHERTPKYDNIIQPDNPLSFGGETYLLQSVVNHIGPTRNSGHYTALLPGGPTGWYDCNDELITSVRYQPSKHNYMFVYSCQSGDQAAEQPPVVKFENLNAKGGVDGAGGQTGSFIGAGPEPHSSPATLVTPATTITNPPGLQPTIPNIVPSHSSIVSRPVRQSAQPPSPSSVPNPPSAWLTGKKVTQEPPLRNSKSSHSANQRSSRAQSGKQAEHDKNSQSDDDFIMVSHPKKRKLNANVGKTKSSKTSTKNEICRGCQKEVILNSHLAKSLPCQTAYKISEKVNKEMNQQLEEREQCLGCQRFFVHIRRHLSSVKSKSSMNCRKFYDMEELRSNNNQQKRKEKSRANQTEAEKIQERKDAQKRMKEFRNDQTEEEKIQERKAAQKGMKKIRNDQTEAEKIQERNAAQERMKEFRHNQISTEEKRFNLFRNSVKYGPIFPCSCCHRLMFDNSVINLTRSKYLENLETRHPGLFDKAVGSLDEDLKVTLDQESFKKGENYHYLCKYCKDKLWEGKIPPISHRNKLQTYKGEKLSFANQDMEKYKDLELTELEQCLIARSLLFMKMRKLPGGERMKAVRDRLVNVPINENDIFDTLDEITPKLPRTPREARIVSVGLKKKKIYKGTDRKENVDIDRMKAALKILKELGHNYYQFVSNEELEKYETRCREEDEEEFEIFFGPSEDQENNTLDDTLEEEEDEEENEIEEMLKEDVRTKWQFQYNVNTLFANDLPESRITSDDANKDVFVAPGENKIPKGFVQDTDWDKRAFPALDPTGQNSLHVEREVKLRDQQFFEQRLLNVNRRFANTASFLFAALQYIEYKRLESNINLAAMRGKRTDTGYTLQNPYTVLDNIPGTPRYFHKKRTEFIAKLENQGGFQFFFTLSCADKRWDSNFTSILRKYPELGDSKIVFEEDKTNGHYEVFIEKGDNKVPLKEYVQDSVGAQKMISENILTATRNFDHRVKKFIQHIIMSQESPMQVEFFNYRVEFQMRGAGHIHGVLWVNFQKFIEKHKQILREKFNIDEDDPTKEYPPDYFIFDDIEKTFEDLSEDKVLQDTQMKSLAKFADKFISCSLKNEKVSDVVKDVNYHKCTRSCQKYGSLCRFHFPKLPIHETIVSSPAKIVEKDEILRNLTLKHAKEAFNTIQEFYPQYSKNLTEEGKKKSDEKQKEYNKTIAVIDEEIPFLKEKFHDADYREETLKRRLIAFLNHLKMKKILNYDDKENEDELSRIKNMTDEQMLAKYKKYLQFSSTGYRIIHQRDIDEVFVNNYNPEFLHCWDGNCDLQITLDHFAIITYITEYMMKDETGTAGFIKKALKDNRNENLKEQLKIVKNVFITHRQVGEAECYYRLFPSMHLSHSNLATKFVHSGFRHERSRMLEEICPEAAEKYNSNDIRTFPDKPGKVYREKTCMEDRYDSRCAFDDNLKFISLAQFVKVFQPVSEKKQHEEDLFDEAMEVFIDQENKVEDEEKKDELSTRVISFQEENRKELFKTYKLGKGKIRRRKPQALSLHKYKPVSETHQHHFSQLRLYYPHSKEDLDVWEEDFAACMNAYNDNLEAIKYVKSRVMKYQERVDEAQSRAIEEINKGVGDILDSNIEQENEDLQEEGVGETDQFIALNPDDFSAATTETTNKGDGRFKRIELEDDQVMLERTRTVDEDQRRVIDIAVQYSRSLRKCQNRSDITAPTPPLVVVQGGAGSGKSFVIDLVAKWVTKILRKPGDDPDHPYVLKLAQTGTAATIIDGMTINSAFNIKFGTKVQSIGDKAREQFRSSLENLQVVIIDEYSLVKSDMLYQIDHRLQEIKMKENIPFGGCAVLMFGDILQIKPVQAPYIFQAPQNPNLENSFLIEPLFEKFKVVNLTKNHRQGEDKEYGDMLARFKVGNVTDEDINKLKSKVMKEDDPRLLSEGLYVTATNQVVNQINEKKLNELSGDLYSFNAIIRNYSTSDRRPPQNNKGEINNTPLQDCLKLKRGAPVMLTVNLDVTDGLVNGARGVVSDFKPQGLKVGEEAKSQRIYVEFLGEKVGQERRKRNPDVKRFVHSKPTPIDRFESEFSNNMRGYSNTIKALAINYPLKLNFSMTCHKIQGSTLKKPEKLIADLRGIKGNFGHGMAYVLLSRIQNLNQLIIVESIDKKYIYPSPTALEYYNQMNSKEKMTKESSVFNYSSLNIRSLKKHFVDLLTEPGILESDLILVQQTCLKPMDNLTMYQIQHFQSHFNSHGNGNGIAIYYKEKYQIESFVNKPNYQISKIVSRDEDVICVYRSTSTNLDLQKEFLQDINSLIEKRRRQIFIGDFNIDAYGNIIVEQFQNLGFKQLVKNPTHEDGNIIDLCFLSDKITTSSIELRQRARHYTDHDLVQLRYI